MKLISYLSSAKNERIGIIVNESVFDLRASGKAFDENIPSLMSDFLKRADFNMNIARKVELSIKSGIITKYLKDKDYQFLAPVPHPTSFRDAYAFREHVATARKNRGVDMIPEFDQFPVFYFTNHNAVIGCGDLIVEKDNLKKLDFELEIAAVIGKKGRNIPSSKADHYIIGYTVMNDFSAREIQLEEMKLSLGPAKGKDFATAIGPWLVSADELKDRLIKTNEGNKYDLRMTAKHNGRQISEGNFKDINWTFGEIIERISYGVDILPGDIIGSGTVGTGCYLELNGTWKRMAEEKGEPFSPVWLQDGDEIVLEVDCLGTLINRIVKVDSDYSILAKKRK